MVIKEIIKNKEGEVLRTKDGLELIDYKFEVGDIFIPQHNTLLEKSNKAEVQENGKRVTKTITSYKIKVIVKDFNNGEPVYVTLTPSQANTFKKKIADDIILTQHLFCAYSYKDKDSNEWVGIGFKNKHLPPKTFEDFEDIEDLKND